MSGGRNDFEQILTALTVIVTGTGFGTGRLMLDFRIGIAVNMSNRGDFDGLSRRFGGLSRRFGRLSRRFDRLSRRLDRLSRRFDRLGRRFDRLGRRFGRLGRRFGRFGRCRFDGSCRCLNRLLRRRRRGCHRHDICSLNCRSRCFCHFGLSVVTTTERNDHQKSQQREKKMLEGLHFSDSFLQKIF